MRFRRARHHLLASGVALLLGPTLAAAQLDPGPDAGRTRLRDRYNRPQSKANVDEGIRKLGSGDPAERLEGVTTLAQSDGDAKAIDHLIQAASDSDTSVRVKAIDSLGNMRAREASGLFVQQIFLRDVDPQTKQHMLVALGKIGDPKTTRPLLNFVASDTEPGLRGNAIYALGDIGDPTAVEPLESLAASLDDPNLKRLATESAARIKARPAPNVVVPSLAGERRPGGPGQPPR